MHKLQKWKTEKKGTPASSASTYWLCDSDQKNLARDAEENNKDAAFRLYLHYAFSNHDPNKSRHWLQKAAQNGHAIAQYSIAHDLIYGEHTNIQEAEIWANESIKNGNQSAFELIEIIEAAKNHSLLKPPQPAEQQQFTPKTIARRKSSSSD